MLKKKIRSIENQIVIIKMKYQKFNIVVVKLLFVDFIGK